jgi:hypothetical protein
MLSPNVKDDQLLAFPPPTTPITPMNYALEFFLRVLLTLIAVAICAFAVYVMVKMNEQYQNQGGRYLVAVGAFILLIGVDTQFSRLAWHRFQVGLTPARGYQRYTARATLALVFAAVFLFSVAVGLP